MLSMIRGVLKKHRFRVIFPIGVRLVIVFTLILFPMLILINVLVSRMASQDLFATAGEDNFTINNRSAAEAESRLNLARRNVHFLLDIIRIAGKESSVARQGTALFFEQSRNIAAVAVPGYVELINDHFLEVNEITEASVSSWILEQKALVERAVRGEPVIVNPSAELKVPLIAVFYPWQRNGLEEALIILLSPDGLAEIFGAGNNSSFMTNMEGDVLVHTDFRMIMNKSNVSDHPLLTALLKTEERDVNFVYTGDGVTFFGAGRKLSFGGLMVFTSVEYDLPFQKTSGAIHRNIYIIVSVIFISIILIWLLSKTITDPLAHLAEAMSRVASGEFDVELKYNFPDEIGVLSRNFIKMEKALEKRERFLESFDRFTNASEADDTREFSAAVRRDSVSRGPGQEAAASFRDFRGKKDKRYSGKKGKSRVKAVSGNSPQNSSGMAFAGEEKALSSFSGENPEIRGTENTQ